jgi:hypothetical protein
MKMSSSALGIETLIGAKGLQDLTKNGRSGTKVCCQKNNARAFLNGDVFHLLRFQF